MSLNGCHFSALAVPVSIEDAQCPESSVLTDPLKNTHTPTSCVYVTFVSSVEPRSPAEE